MAGRTMLEVLDDMSTTHQSLDSIAQAERFQADAIDEMLGKVEPGSVEEVCLRVMQRYAICLSVTTCSDT